MSDAGNVCAVCFSMMRNFLLRIVIACGNYILTSIHLVVNIYYEFTLLQFRFHHEPIDVIIKEGAHWILKLLD